MGEVVEGVRSEREAQNGLLSLFLTIQTLSIRTTR